MNRIIHLIAFEQSVPSPALLVFHGGFTPRINTIDRASLCATVSYINVESTRMKVNAGAVTTSALDVRF